MKRTYPIKQGEYRNLLKKFINEFGYPTYYQELVIYFECRDHFKITLTRDGLRWSWADEVFSRTNQDPYIKSNHSIRTNLNDLKEKLLFLGDKYGNKGYITTALVLHFLDEKRGIRVELRPKSLIGELLSIIIPKTYSERAKNKNLIDNFFNDQIKSHVEGNLLEKTSKLEKECEEVFNFNTSGSPILNTKILDFCKENGIMNPFNNDCTYRKLLASKSNNYSIYEDLFLDLTSTNLLAVEDHCILPNRPKKTISIIIPCYNSESTISKVLRSIKYQEIPEAYLKHTEVIIIDDASDSEISKAININDYPFRIEIIRLNRNHGISHARQLGVTHSTGDILIFIDADVILSKYYLSDHVIRNAIINNGVFVSFKENISEDDSRILDASIRSGVELPKYFNDLRFKKRVEKDAIGSYNMKDTIEIKILEETNYFKDFHGSRVFGVYDLSCMVTGHNFSVKKELVLQSSPFSQMFKGWGMEDVYFGLKMISNGNFIIPILSSGVFHINHPPRSGSDEKKKQEYKRNTEIINKLLDSIVE